MGTFVATGSPLDRALAFLREYIDAPSDADIEFRIGQSEDREAAVIIDIGKSRHAFTSDEALAVADIAERTLNEFPHSPSTAGFPNLILGIRATAAKSVSPTKSEGET